MSVISITAALIAGLHAGFDSPDLTISDPAPAPVLAPALAPPQLGEVMTWASTWLETGTAGIALELTQAGRTTRWRWIDPRRSAGDSASNEDRDTAGKDTKAGKRKTPKPDKGSQTSDTSKNSSRGNSRWGSQRRDGTPSNNSAGNDGADENPTESVEAAPPAGGLTEPPEASLDTPPPVDGAPDPAPDVPVDESAVGGDPQPAPDPDPAATAPQPVPPEFVATVGADSMVTLTEVATGREIISPNRMPLWTPNGGFPEEDSLPPTVIFQPKTNGFDVVYQFTNDTGVVKKIGNVYVGGIRFGQEIMLRKFDTDGKELVVNHNNSNYFDGGNSYPYWYYSPVIVAREGNIVLGASMCYNAVSYQHNVLMRMESPGGKFTEGGRNWQMLFQLNSKTEFSEAGNIQPGETRTYKLTLRAEKLKAGDHENEWLRTLVPYRDYFVGQYGGVQYERDPRPIAVFDVSSLGAISTGNERGWNGNERLDTHGWGMWVDRLAAVRDRGFNRFVMYGAGGMYNINRENNYPFQITSPWNQFPVILNTLPLLQSFIQSVPSGELGFWWGRSVQVMKTWDTPTIEILDPSNPEHVQLGFAEMDNAVLAGATTIGLDSVAAQGVWDTYEWLTMLHERYPQVKFIAEPLSSDILHTLAGTFVYGTRVGVDEAYNIEGPIVLADFINQGHEVWAGISANPLRILEGIPAGDDIPEEVIRLYMRRLADMGYVPFVQLGVTLNWPINAVESWNNSVPADLIR